MSNKQPETCQGNSGHYYSIGFIGVDPRETYLLCSRCGHTKTIETTMESIKFIAQSINKG